MKRDKLTKFLGEYLNTKDFDDYCPNGLQVEGKEKIEKIIIGVSACVDLFERAIEKKADTIIVHHGLIWNFDRPLYKGGYKKRVKLLLENDLNLYGFHLPLDAHPEVGNNAQIAKLLGLKNIESFGEYRGSPIGTKGILDNAEPDSVFNKIKRDINHDSLIFPYGSQKIKTVGIISGGAQKEVQQAVSQKLDLYITGEVSEFNIHIVKEEGLHFVAAGHHATERFGIKALGEKLTQKFGVKVEFIDIPNPA